MYIPFVAYSKIFQRIFMEDMLISMKNIIRCIHDILPFFSAFDAFNSASLHGYSSQKCLTVNRPHTFSFPAAPPPPKKNGPCTKRFYSKNRRYGDVNGGTLQFLWLPRYRLDFAWRLKTSLGTRVPWAEELFVGVSFDLKAGEAQHVFWQKATMRLSTTRRPKQKGLQKDTKGNFGES